jgi:hypothetical protein
VAKLRDIVVDCGHPASLARFWIAVLDDYELAPYDEEELERLRANGIMSVEDDPTVLAIPRGGTGPRIFFVLVPEARTVKNRVHLDLVGADLDVLLSLGAGVIAEYEDHRVLADPEGNEFCLFPPR